MRSRPFTTLLCCVAAGGGLLVVAAPAAHAYQFVPGVSGLCGTATMGTMPTDLRQDATEHGTVRVLPESAVELTTPVAVDAVDPGVYDRPSALPSPQPVVPVGNATSFLLHWDPPGAPVGTVSRTVTVGFSAPIAGVQVRDITVSSVPSQQFHPAGATYPSSAAGLQLAADGSGDALRILDRHTISISFAAGAAVEDFRVVLPGSAAEYPGRLAAGPDAAAYSMLAGDGGVFVLGVDSGFWGSLGATRLNQPVVGGARTCAGRGYRLAARDGGVFAFGDATFHGSLGGAPPAAAVVALAPTATGDGYYLVTATGAVSAFGDAQRFGDASAVHLNAPIVGMAATPTGHGYWLVASDGGIFAYGDAVFAGSTGAIRLNRPIVGMRPAPGGNGYYLFASDGGVFTFSVPHAVVSAVPFFGSAGASGDVHPFVGMRLAADGAGYWLADTAGRVFGFGPSAPSSPGLSTLALASPIVTMM